MQQCNLSSCARTAPSPHWRAGTARHAHLQRSSHSAVATGDTSRGGAWTQPAPAQLADPASQLQLGSLLQGQHAQYGDVYAEVVAPWDTATQSAIVAWQGRTWRLSQSDGQTGIIMRSEGSHVAEATKALSSKVPGVTAALTKLQQYLDQQAASEDAAQHTVVTLGQPVIVDSLTELRQRVGANPGPWVRGTGPEDPPPTGSAYQVLCAGELLALMAGHRGLAMVQLYLEPSLLSGDGTSGSGQLRQPSFNPYVLTLLKEAAANPQLGMVLTSTAGGLGVTALVFADKQPFRAWAEHLTSFGAQAALVADSPYYKLLIGRVLGYREGNIHHHIRTVHGPGHPSQPVIQAVDKELSRLSSKKPFLPWNKSSRGKSKKL